MAASNAFNATVAARTRAARHIQESPDLLALYKANGGLEADLATLVAEGRRAEALNQVRSSAGAHTGAATADALEAFADLQREYAAVMAVVQAVRTDLAEQNAASEVLSAVDKILVNEAALVIRTVEILEGDPATRKTQKKAVRSKGQEALRAEIHKDAAALLELKAAHGALEKRAVTVARLQELRSQAETLQGKLAVRASRKGAGKDATRGVHEAVQRQKSKWRACYRILALTANRDDRVRQLLREAAGG
jgi:hypothetical protein